MITAQEDTPAEELRRFTKPQVKFTALKDPSWRPYWAYNAAHAGVGVVESAAGPKQGPPPAKAVLEEVVPFTNPKVKT
jgi:hypothetical protein